MHHFLPFHFNAPPISLQYGNAFIKYDSQRNKTSGDYSCEDSAQKEKLKIKLCMIIY